jgi:hypothetical protein
MAFNTKPRKILLPNTQCNISEDYNIAHIPITPLTTAFFVNTAKQTAL